MTETERNHKGKLGGRTLNIAKWTDKFKYGMMYLIFLNKENIATLANHVFSFLLQIQAVGTGWVSLALTFRGSMMGSDVLVGWVSEKGAATIIVSLFHTYWQYKSYFNCKLLHALLWFQFLNAKDKSLSKEYHTGSAPSASVASLYWHQGGSR